MSQISHMLGDVSFEMVTYIWVFNKFALFEWDYSTIKVWIITALLYDIGYYITHRTGHEWNFMWAGTL